MRVISKEKDYFDTSGIIDPEVIFVRKQSTFIVDIDKPYSVSDVGLVGFCGKFYPYIHKKISHIPDQTTGIQKPDTHFYYYSLEAFKESPFWKKESKQRYRWRPTKIEDYINFFNHWTPSDKLFIQVNSPYFRIKSFNSWNKKNDAVLITNPSLVDMQFGKVVDANTAFQSVQFYLTNQLVKPKEMIEIDDKYRIANKGFDKYSFRHPTKLKDLK